MKRYHLVLPDKLYARLEKCAERREASVASLIRRYIDVGLLISQNHEEGADLIIRTKEKEFQVLP